MDGRDWPPWRSSHEFGQAESFPQKWSKRWTAPAKGTRHIKSLATSVGDDQFAGHDWARARQLAEGSGEPHSGEDRAINGEFDDVGCVVPRQRLPENEQDNLRGGDSPDRSVEIAALPTFSLGGAADARQNPENSQG